MPDRSLNRAVGETSLERKCLFLFGTCLLILITSGFWWYFSQTDELVLEAARRTAMGLKGTILLRQHLKLLTVPQDFEKNEAMYRDLGEEPTEANWRFLRPILTRDKQPLDETEAAILARFVNPPPDDIGWDEVRMRGEYRYFLPIKANSAGCVACHSQLSGQGDLQIGSLIAVMEIALPDAGIRQEQSKNRAILMANAAVTFFMSMVAVYFIIRYVIVKPAAH